MPIDTNEMRMYGSMIPHLPDIDRALMEAADYIDTLRRQLNEAHSHNQDSERMDWLELQVHHEYNVNSHRSYFMLPRLCSKKSGESTRTLRQAIDAYRTVKGDKDD